MPHPETDASQSRCHVACLVGVGKRMDNGIPTTVPPNPSDMINCPLSGLGMHAPEGGQAAVAGDPHGVRDCSIRRHGDSVVWVSGSGHSRWAKVDGVSVRPLKTTPTQHSQLLLMSSQAFLVASPRRCVAHQMWPPRVHLPSDHRRMPWDGHQKTTKDWINAERGSGSFTLNSAEPWMKSRTSLRRSLTFDLGLSPEPIDRHC